MQKVCHVELGPHNYLITHFQLHHLFSIAPPHTHPHPPSATIPICWDLNVGAVEEKREHLV